MIVNHELIIDYLSNWIADYAKQSGKNLLTVCYRGSRSDSLLLHLCTKAKEFYSGISTYALWSSPSGDIRKIYSGNCSRMLFDDEESFLCCHRKSKKDGIIVGQVDRTFGLYYRSYGKRAEGTADIFPLFDLEYSDIVEITDKLWPNLEYGDEHIRMYDLEDAKGIEFCNEAEKLYGIITSETLPNKHQRWPYFISDQKEILAFVHQREKSTRHKRIDKPYPILSDKEQLIHRI